jgi:hypothetical protein
MHQNLQSAREETVIDEVVLLDREARVPPLQVPDAVIRNPMP